MPQWKFDADARVFTLALVVLFQLFAQGMRLSAHDGIFARRIIGLAIEHLDPDQMFIDLLTLAGKNAIANEA